MLVLSLLPHAQIPETSSKLKITSEVLDKIIATKRAIRHEMFNKVRTETDPFKTEVMMPEIRAHSAVVYKEALRLAKEKLVKDGTNTWRNFTNDQLAGRQISKEWRVGAVSTSYILDHNGVICHKASEGLHGESLVKAITVLINEIE